MGMTQHVERSATQQHTVEEAQAVAAEHDQIGAPLVGFGEYLGSGSAAALGDLQLYVAVEPLHHPHKRVAGHPDQILHPVGRQILNDGWKRFVHVQGSDDRVFLACEGHGHTQRGASVR